MQNDDLEKGALQNKISLINSLNASSKFYKKGVSLIEAVLFTFLSGAVFTDLYKDKIYNLWVVPAFLTGMIIAALGGADKLITTLTAVGITFILLLPVYLFKGIAAGDVKLFMAAAVFMSAQETFSCILLSFLIAGIISLIILIFKRNKKKTIHFAVPVLISALFVVGGVL
ncbi:MAG: A24 family peptidase [Treponema sp.]|nr:A24 family peptidase [Treponema sp.]